MLGTGLSSAIGHSILIVGLAASVFGAFALATGTALRNERVQRAVHLYGFIALAAAVGAVVLMERGLITRDWSLAYVQKVGSRHTPPLFNFTALWSALEGSILLWLLLLAVPHHRVAQVQGAAHRPAHLVDRRRDVCRDGGPRDERVGEIGRAHV